MKGASKDALYEAMVAALAQPFEPGRAVRLMRGDEGAFADVCSEAAADLLASERSRADRLEQDLEQLEDILGSVYLHINWRYVTKQLTTEQKERFADAVLTCSRRLNGDTGDFTDRWWRAALLASVEENRQ